MTVALADPADLAAETASAEVSWVTAEGVPQRLQLYEAAAVAFENGLPVRRFTAREGQRHLSGRWWCATMSGHVSFESWLERDHVMLLEFDAALVVIAAQPFWLSWPQCQRVNGPARSGLFRAAGRWVRRSWWTADRLIGAALLIWPSLR